MPRLMVTKQGNVFIVTELIELERDIHFGVGCLRAGTFQSIMHGAYPTETEAQAKLAQLKGLNNVK